MPEKGPQESIEKSMSPKSKDSLIELGRNTAKNDPGVAAHFFQQAGLSPEEIQTEIMKKEFEEIDKGKTKKGEEQNNKKILRSMYEAELEKARISGDENVIKTYENALKKIEEE